MPVRIFAQRNAINIERTRTQDILQWTYNVKTMSKKVERLPANDIRRYCV